VVSKSLRAEAGRRVLFAVRPLGDRRLDVNGTCSVCGASTRFVHNSWVLPDDMKRDLGPDLARGFAARESLFCRDCGSSLRVRRLVDVLLEHYADSATTLGGLLAEPGFRRLDVAEINSVGTIHGALSAHHALAYSEYRPGAPLGSEVAGIRNEDVCRLTYEAGSFDLVLTSDTLEHVPELELALREIRRVLRPGGRHVFTVPLVPSRESSIVRARLGDDGAVVHLEEPRYHGRGSGPFRLVSRKGDMLVFTDPGMDLVPALTRAGFQTEMHARHPGDVALVLCSTAV
jgi:SAM-dependent methyltransferase